MIEDLKKFERILRICRRQGVTNFTIENMSIIFGDLPMKDGNVDAADAFPTDELSPEELMYYAVNK